MTLEDTATLKLRTRHADSGVRGVSLADASRPMRPQLAYHRVLQ
jgi:hypothetical protein